MPCMPHENSVQLERLPIRDLPMLGDNTQVFLGVMIGWLSAPIINQFWRGLTRRR